jgi:predicted negative regulator of RcsB-dependent stress response
MKTWAFIGILLGVITLAAFYYYNDSQARITALQENNARLEENFRVAERAIEQNLETIDRLQDSYIRIYNDYEMISAEFQEIRRANNQLRDRLSRHELDALAAARPGLVENAINNASRNALRCFELLAGAPLTEREMNATTANQFNSECPWLFNTR